MVFCVVKGALQKSGIVITKKNKKKSNLKVKLQGKQVYQKFIRRLKYD